MSEEQIYVLAVEEAEDEGERLDRYLVDKLPNDCSRTFVQRLISDDCVRVNDKPVKASYSLRLDDELRVVVPAAEPYDVTPENIPLDILFEDEHLLVINKPVGMVVHPAYGHMEHTLVHALLYHCKNLSGINGVLRPGIVHRLDKDTSGLLVVAKDDVTHRGLSAQLQDRSLSRVYQTIVCGQFKYNQYELTTRIGRSKRHRKRMAVLDDIEPSGKEAISFFSVKERFLHATLLEVSLRTGRTHQIRVHAQHLGCAVLGDPVYHSGQTIHLTSGAVSLNRQALHAYHIKFIHPISKEDKEFTCDLPSDMQAILDRLRAEDAS